MTKHPWPCPGKPEDLLGQPLGMYHCEFCGEMQLAGVAHLPPQFPEAWQEPFPKAEWMDTEWMDTVTPDASTEEEPSKSDAPE